MSSHHLDVNIPKWSQGEVTNVYYEYIQLSQGINEGNVEAVKDFLNRHPEAVDAWINIYETPLLKACACEKPEIVKELLRRMTPEQMLPKITWEESFYHTPLTVVAESGNLEIAEALVTKNPNLIETPGRYGKIPVVIAVEKRQNEMARYLYVRTPVHVLLDKDGYHGTDLFVNAIFYKMLDIALDLFSICKHLAFTKHEPIKWIPVIVLASKPDLFPGYQYLGPLKRFIYSWIQVKLPILTKASHVEKDHYNLLGKLLKCLLKWTGIDEVYQLKVMHLQVKKLLLGISEETLTMGSEERRESVDEALFSAVRFGNVEFLVEMVKNNSELLWSTEYSLSSDLFFLAIEYRQKEVLNFLYGLKQRHLLFRGDSWGRAKFFDLACSIAPPHRLATIAGAALQMQSEFKWFMEIERIAPEIEKERRDIFEDNAIELFACKHHELRQEAQKAMKEMAGSCSLVATLIVTVTFAAVFSMPGGSTAELKDNEFKIWDWLFLIFIVTDIISCLTACTSVLIFLGILTSRYSLEDFVVSLPKKMIAGLSLMFVSIAAMLLAFWSAIFTTLDERSWFIAPVVVVACFPAILFVQIQYPLLKEMIILTYDKGILDRNTRPTHIHARPSILKVLTSNLKYFCHRLRP